MQPFTRSVMARSFGMQVAFVVYWVFSAVIVSIGSVQSASAFASLLIASSASLFDGPDPHAVTTALRRTNEDALFEDPTDAHHTAPVRGHQHRSYLRDVDEGRFCGLFGGCLRAK